MHVYKGEYCKLRMPLSGNQYIWYDYKYGSEVSDEHYKAMCERGLWVGEKEEEKSVKERVENYKEDLEDDGKRNYSNDPEKKSPGRKPRKRKKKE